MPLLGLGSRYGDKNLEMPLLIYYELSEWVKVNWTYTPQNLNQVRQLIWEAHEPEKLMRLEKVLEEQLGHRILDVAEEMKIALSEQTATLGSFSFIDRALDVAMTQTYMQGLLEKTMAPVKTMMLETLQVAGVKEADIAIVILIGGTTGLPVFQEWIKTHFFIAG